MIGIPESLSRLVHRTRGKHHRPFRWHRQATAERAQRHMTWLGKISPATPGSPAPAMVPEENSGQPLGPGADETAGAGVPRITRYARMTWPQPDDTVFDLPRIPGQFRPATGTFRDALGRPCWPC